jgi:RNA polymerase primary sigma factor
MARTRKTNVKILKKHSSLQKSKRISKKAKTEKADFAKANIKAHIAIAKSVKTILGNDNATAPNGDSDFLLKDEINDKIKELVRLAKEQGYLTYSDINEALPDKILSPDDYDDILAKLRSFDIEIVDQAEVDQIKQIEPLDDEDKEHLDILDDPVRMYLKQMGQVPLLTENKRLKYQKELKRLKTG